MHLTGSLWLRDPCTALLFIILRLRMLLPRPLRRLGGKRSRRRYSVVTAVCNAERWLPAYFTSLLCQTLDVEACLEILCVDDGSTDGSVAVIRQWQARYPGMIRLVRKENGGPASARNMGIEAAGGEWLTFVDADDFVHPAYFAAVDDFLDAPTKHSLGMVVCNYLMFKESNGVYKDSHPLRQRFREGERRIPAGNTGTFVQVVCNSAFFLRRVFLETGIRQKEDVRPTFEDGEMVMRYVAAIASIPGMDIGVLPRARYYHRRMAGFSSLSQRAYQDPAHFDAPLALGCLRLLRELGAGQGEAPLFARMTVLYCLSRYMRRVVEDGTFAGLDASVKRRFFALTRDVLALIETSDILAARHVDAPLFFVPLLLAVYKGCEPSSRRVFVEDRRPDSREVHIFYHSRSPLGDLEFFHDGRRLEPAHAETVELPAWDGHILHEHRLRLLLETSGGVVRCEPGTAAFFRNSGGGSLGESLLVDTVATPRGSHVAFCLAGHVLKPFFWCAHLVRNTLVKHDPVFEGCDACPHLLQPVVERITGPLVPEFPVDVVYAWVDGNDPALAAKRAAWLPPEKSQEAVSHGPALHRDNDELRYSLRSLEAYAPWVRHVFILTDSQVPAWLDTAHPQLRIVDHRDYIPHEYLPTFSSRPIEAFLHQVPGLGEHYVYLNDDFFLAAPCGKDLFFTANGLPRLFTDWRPSRRHGFEHPKSPHTFAYGNAVRYLEARGVPVDPAVIVAHAPYAQTLSLASDAHAFYEEAVRCFAHNRFRSREDLAFASQAVPLFACATKRAAPCDVPYYYINTKRFDHQAHYAALLLQKGKPCQPPFFCCNDVGKRSRSNAWQDDMAAFLRTYYPEPSSFEKPGC